MRAVTCRRYGSPDALKAEEVQRPSSAANEVLVAVHSSSVTSGDARMRSFEGAGSLRAAAQRSGEGKEAGSWSLPLGRSYGRARRR